MTKKKLLGGAMSAAVDILPLYMYIQAKSVSLTEICFGDWFSIAALARAFFGGNPCAVT